MHLGFPDPALQRWGLRIIKDGTEVFKQTNQTTNRTSFELESFDFSTNSDFRILTTTTFEFELLGYDPVSGSNGLQYIYFDEIRINACCESICNAQGGFIIRKKN